MISIEEWLNPSRVIGLTADFFALGACGFAWVRGLRARRRTPLAAALTLLEAALLVDLVSNARWLLHDLLAHAAVARHIYAERSGPQLIALGLLISMAGAAIGLALWHFRHRPGAALALCGGMLSVCCWWIEVISLHAVDGVLYRRIDGITLIRFAWAACSLMTGIGMLWDTFAVRAKPRTGERTTVSYTT